MAKIYYKDDCDLGLLKDKTVAIIGYGSQGHAHALNLNDSGVKVVVGIMDGCATRDKAAAAGLTVLSIAEAAEKADVIMILIPDEFQQETYEKSIAPSLKEGKTLMFAHGFNIHFKKIVPPSNVDVVMIAPKGPGHTVRSEYKEGKGVPALVAIHQDASGNALKNALAYAAGIGCSRAGVLQTEFKEETETDLFGEQAVLCGGVTELMKAGFETLVNAGYQPEIAYFECVHEMKLIIDLIYRGGYEFMRYSVSNTAEWGDYQIGKRIITDKTRKEMQKVLKEVQNGKFADQWMEENKTGRKNLEKIRASEKAHSLENVGKELRKMYSWSDQDAYNESK